MVLLVVLVVVVMVMVVLAHRCAQDLETRAQVRVLRSGRHGVARDAHARADVLARGVARRSAGVEEQGAGLQAQHGGTDEFEVGAAWCG